MLTGWRSEATVVLYLRLESALAQTTEDEDCRHTLRDRLQELQADINPVWVALVDRPAIENCDYRDAARCPKRWPALTVLDDGLVRYCSTCREGVYYASSLEQARPRARQGDRIAVASWVKRSAGDLEVSLSMLRRINRTVREYMFLPVDGGALAEPMRGHFAALTPPFVRLGFHAIGDFQMKPEPVAVHNRFFLSACGRTLATICCVLQTGVASLISVLEDGTCIHTSGTNNPHPERTFTPADRLSLIYLPGGRPRNMLRRHEEAIRTAAGAEAIRFHRDQFRAMMVYDQRLFNRWRFRHGTLDREPPAPDFSTLRRP
jgi:hypothetical protein